MQLKKLLQYMKHCTICDVFHINETVIALYHQSITCSTSIFSEYMCHNVNSVCISIHAHMLHQFLFKVSVLKHDFVVQRKIYMLLVFFFVFIAKNGKFVFNIISTFPHTIVVFFLQMVTTWRIYTSTGEVGTTLYTAYKTQSSPSSLLWSIERWRRQRAY